MQQFNYQQKIAMMRILLDVIHADGKIDARDMFYFNELKKELEVPDDSQKDVEEKNSLLALVQIKLFDDEQKEFFSKLMSNMIVVDEDVNVNEVAIYDVVKEFAKISQKFQGKID